MLLSKESDDTPRTNTYGHAAPDLWPTLLPFWDTQEKCLGVIGTNELCFYKVQIWLSGYLLILQTISLNPVNVKVSINE